MRLGMCCLMLAVFVRFGGISLAADNDSALVAEGLCSEMTQFVDGLADFTTTKCFPGASKGGTEFILITEKPVFSVEASRKAWLMVAVAAVGKTLNDQPAYKASTILFADAGMAAHKQYYSLSAQTAKNLQQKTSNGTLDLDAFWAGIESALKPFKS